MSENNQGAAAGNSKKNAGYPSAYWLNEPQQAAFQIGKPIERISKPVVDLLKAPFYLPRRSGGALARPCTGYVVNLTEKIQSGIGRSALGSLRK